MLFKKRLTIFSTFLLFTQEIFISICFGGWLYLGFMHSHLRKPSGSLVRCGCRPSHTLCCYVRSDKIRRWRATDTLLGRLTWNLKHQKTALEAPNLFWWVVTLLCPSSALKVIFLFIWAYVIRIHVLITLHSHTLLTLCRVSWDAALKMRSFNRLAVIIYFMAK